MGASLSTMKLIRYAVAYVFIVSGLMKLVHTETANHFLGLGLPYPELMLKLVIILEIGCGIFILLNKSVKTAAIPLIAIMIAAIMITKLPIVNTGLLQFAFNAKLDIVMLVLLLILYNRYP
ncbi:DoxX family protein [Neobacillus mesonae]|uniref:DoxX family membrane protein n=1 Tax=Neobacillus mesonae TaxID=1193713 RepID=A0A3T0HV51_9BACI|nr:DoxX family protein [Neobacillus mesonae]AZU60943.1 DoxX family membrane protein [Neobacillus mesonae]MED4202523.1 DoxX family protein [Neobacillus mesonae]